MFIRMYRLLISIQWKWMNIVAVKLNFFFTKSTIYMTCTIFQSIGSHVILQNIIVFVQINNFECIIALVSLLIYSIKPRHGFTHHSWLLCSGLMLETGLKWSQVKLNSSQTHMKPFLYGLTFSHSPCDPTLSDSRGTQHTFGPDLGPVFHPLIPAWWSDHWS